MKKSAALLFILSLFFSLVACSPQVSQTSSITGSVYFDQNSDEECDCECGIPQVNIRLYSKACGGELLEVIHTDEDGIFIFENLEPGSYCVFSDLDPQCNGFMPTTSISQSLDLKAGERITLDGFGYNLFVDEVQK